MLHVFSGAEVQKKKNGGGKLDERFFERYFEL